MRKLIGLALLCGIATAGRAHASDADAITVLRDLAYREGPSRAWRLDLAMPSDLRGRPRPGIVVIHGGGWVEGDKSSFVFRDRHTPANSVDFARLGFVAVTINYRLSGEAPYPAALDDCQAAVRWLRAHAAEYNLDRDHVGAYGNSAGGHLALLLAMTGTRAEEGPYRGESSAVQAAASDSGPIDLVHQFRDSAISSVVGRFLGGPPEGDRLAVYREASPIQYARRDTPPLLLIYGAADLQVPVVTADAFVHALGKAGAQDVTYHRLAYVDHCPHSLVALPETQRAVEEFFLRTLMHPETARDVRRRKGP